MTKKKKNFLKTLIVCILACSLCLAGCGAGTPEPGTETQGSGAGTPEPGTETQGSGAGTPEPSTEIQSSGAAEGSVAPSSQPEQSQQIGPDEYLRQPLPQQIVPEGKEIITLGAFSSTLIDPIYKSVTAFNKAQDQYFVRIDIYDSYNKFLIDIARKQGTDLYDLSMGTSVDDLVEKGILEDLAPYFDSSDIVGRKDVVDAVWRAGSVDDKLYFLIPGFMCSRILVEKGYTKEGAWSGRDYLELGKKYPGSMLSDNIQNPSGQILSQLKEYMGSFIDWEGRTCSFDSAEFIALLEDLKALSSYRYEAVDSSATLAELLRGKVYLTCSVQLRLNPGLSDYTNVKDAFGDDYEIAGVPTADGSLKYAMSCSQMYGMNAASENKEGAWTFLEYLLSEDFQKPYLPKGDDPLLGSWFPARKDSLEQGLQAVVDYVEDPDGRISYIQNRYIQEKQKTYGRFTEEDKQAVLRMIDNTYRSTFSTDYALLAILFEETEPFFQGDKSVEDVAKIIQSRISLYLAE